MTISYKVYPQTLWQDRRRPGRIIEVLEVSGLWARVRQVSPPISTRTEAALRKLTLMPGKRRWVEESLKALNLWRDKEPKP